MIGCPFCKLDKSLFYNSIIEETSNFIDKPCLGALVPGYILILPKKHVYCMTQFNLEIMAEYIAILEKYRRKFKELYGKYPIVFEHGTPDPCGLCTNCVIHAHTHIVNHNYKNEKDVINKMNFKIISSLNTIEDKNYIYYKSFDGKEYITYDFEPISQVMRIFIAEDLSIKEKYDWRRFPFEENIYKTLEDLKED